MSGRSRRFPRSAGSPRSITRITREDALEALGLPPTAPLVLTMAENHALRQALAALTQSLNSEREQRRATLRPRRVAA